MGIDQEVHYRLCRTGKGVRVDRRDGTGLKEGVFGKKILQYFYGDDARRKALRYAHRQAEDTRGRDWVDDNPVRVVDVDGEVVEPQEVPP